MFGKKKHRIEPCPVTRRTVLTPHHLENLTFLALTRRQECRSCSVSCAMPLSQDARSANASCLTPLLFLQMESVHHVEAHSKHIPNK